MQKRQVKTYDKSFLLRLLRQMLLIRRFEEKAAQMYGLQKIGGFCHLYIGQEAAAAGSVSVLDLSKDYVLDAYRDHGMALACGMDPRVLMAELYGKETGCSRGKGGSMHFFDRDRHFYGGNGIVGAHIPLSAGVAMAVKYREEKGVVLCFFGDGAIHQGSFHETVNMAKIWRLPVFFICENNQYGMGTDFRRVSSVADFSVMGNSYGIEGRSANGMDVLEVYDTVNEMAEKVRSGSTPAFLELKTYRYKGHSMSDPAKYRTRKELDAYREQDPVLLLKARMVRDGQISEEEFLELDGDLKKEVQKAVEFAQSSSEPPLESLYEDVLAP
ncbi:MAG: pyruvate dehydrogenase (acetyl-transferring) E1 component subunit alpha [Chitinispirillaceae bacterium]